MNFARFSLILLVLSGCAQNKQNVTVPTSAKYVPCEVLTILTYDSDNDTELTVTDIRKYNAVYRKLCQ